jgi:lysophospholipase L1-like esterase
MKTLSLRATWLILAIAFFSTSTLHSQQPTLHVLGDSFASNFDNTVGPFDWPTLLEQRGYGLELNAFPGNRFSVHHAPNVATWFPVSNADILIIASGLNDALTDFSATAPGNAFYEDEFAPFYTDNTFTSPDSWNVLRILNERAVAQWRQDQPDKPIVMFNLPPYRDYLTDIGGIVSFRLNRGAAYNAWLESYAAANDDITLFDIDGYLQGKLDNGESYYIETGGPSSPRLHPNPATQMGIANEVSFLVNDLIATPEPSSLFSFGSIGILAFSSRRRKHN